MKDENNHKLGDQFKNIYVHNNAKTISTIITRA